MPICENCRSHVADDATFCSNCGRRRGGRPIPQSIAQKLYRISNSKVGVAILIGVVVILVVVVTMITI